MCYAVIFSTTSTRNLEKLNNDTLHFSREIPDLEQLRYLQYPNKWHLTTDGSCSCGFRHLDMGADELGFSEPEDWLPEEPEDIQATLQVVAILKSLLAEGEKLDCIDVWHGGEHTKPSIKNKIAVNLNALSDVKFRFIENYLFNFSNGT
ncbi:Uncharacterised protein [Ectopseudomonas mendocina]|uniref:Uncharacterized protein n=1 Tax=Ectopseudomonas mendocina TaxID=300 RepID=A0A379ITW9_ECTME|nr:hypothetical protein [Pseudomonas mendocina]SUD39501.1 Uncharacterised protein [Pseudomonas mendocina]